MTLDKKLTEDAEAMMQALHKVRWFYGEISRTRAENTLMKLKQDGMFLIRQSRMCPGDFVLSMFAKGSCSHFLIKDVGGDRCYQVPAGTRIEGLDELVDHHRTAEHGLPSCLRDPCPEAKVPPPHSVLTGYTNVLHKAVKGGKKDLLQAILKHSKCPDLNWKDNDGSTALHIACLLGMAKVVQKLIKAGADVNGLDRQGYTPLHRACQKNHASIVDMLLKEGKANPQKSQRPSMNVPLHEAAREGHDSCVMALLLHGAPAWPRNENGLCPYDLAVKHGKKSCGLKIEGYTAPAPTTRRELWFHPDITREDSTGLLQSLGVLDGYFLVRTSSKGPGTYVLSMCSKSQVSNHMIKSSNDKAYFLSEGPVFTSLEHVVQHYSTYMDGIGCVLTHAVSPDKEVTLVKTGEKVPQNDPEGVYDTLANPEGTLPLPPPRIKASHGGSYLKIPRSEIDLGSELGQGEYGSVLNGIWTTGHGQKQPVAIKTLNEENMSNSREVFLQEAQIMVKFDHPYIVQLLGVCEGPPLMLIQELLTDGSLQDFLLDYPDNIQKPDLFRWAGQIALGMNYLEEKKFVHRDLATRNVLLKDKGTAKVGDFGLSRAVGDNDYYKATQGGRWPVKWYAPECMYYGMFSHASDVWSFGVTLWEMFTYGEQPYEEKTGAEVVQMIEKNYRLEQPDDCPDEIYKKMRECWNYEASKRPSFKSLHTFFSSIHRYSNVTLPNMATLAAS